MWSDFSTSSTMMMLVTQWEIGLQNENKTKNQTNKHIVCIWYFQSNLVIVAWYSSLLMWVIIFWIARLLPEIGSTINSNHPCQVKLFQIFDPHRKTEKNGSSVKPNNLLYWAGLNVWYTLLKFLQLELSFSFLRSGDILILINFFSIS